jgi:uncharacterized protein YqeY
MSSRGKGWFIILVMLREQVQDQMKQAMRDKDRVRLDALRYLWSEVRNAEIDAKVELDDQAIQAVVAREVKKRKEALRQAQGKQGDEMKAWVEEEEAKLEVLVAFLPEQMSREEIEKVVDEVVASGASDFGAVMGRVMEKVKGKAEGKLVSEVVKGKLAK